MQLDQNEKNFLAKRARLIRAWPLIGSLLASLLIAFGAWLVFSRPLFANPFFVLAELESNAIDTPTLAVMAVMLPLMALLCLVLTLVIVLMLFAALNNEKRHITLIQRLLAAGVDEGVDVAKAGGQGRAMSNGT